jgi:cell division protein FtsB
MKQLYSIEKEKNKRENRVKDKIATILLIIVSILFVTSLIQTIMKVRKMNKEIASRESQLDSLKKDEDALKKKYEEITSPEYMEKQLRNQLNLAKENEIVLVLPEDEILKKLVPPDDQEVTYDARSNWRKWYELFL